MTHEEVQKLAALARIELSADEVKSFTTEMSSVLDYVSQIQDIVGNTNAAEKSVGARFNIFRPDEVTNEPDEYTDSLISSMPNSSGRFMVVKKILKTDTE